jgi:hypothetical protein
LLLEIEIAALQFEFAKDDVRVELAMVGQHDDMLAVGRDRVFAGRVDHQRAIMPQLLLQPGMAVIPVGAGLPDRELVGEAFARIDAGEADSGNAVHLERQDQPVPVDRGLLVGERVDESEPRLLPFAQPDQRGGRGAVDPDRVALAPVDHHHLVGDAKVDVVARDGRHRLDDAA